MMSIVWGRVPWLWGMRTSSVSGAACRPGDACDSEILPARPDCRDGEAMRSL
jgi:hypothetical protein